MSFLGLPSVFWDGIFFVFGLCLGSFINVIVVRLPKGKSIIWGRSRCDYCRHTLTVVELIPLFSYFFQFGKSRCCKKRLSFFHPMIEIFTGVVMVMVSRSLMVQPFASFVLLVQLFSATCLVVALESVFFIDWRHEIIPLEMIGVGTIGALGFRIMELIARPVSLSWEFIIFSFFLPSLIPAFFFFLIWWLSKGKAMGDGDIFLIALIGFVLGYPDVIISLYLAFLTGSVVGVILMIGGKKGLKSHIPFGPFLIIGFIGALLWAKHIIAV